MTHRVRWADAPIGDIIEKEFAMNIRQKIQTAICVAVIATACLAVTPKASAQLAPSYAICTGEGNQVYSPAVIATPRETTISASGLFSCALTSIPGRTGGSFTLTGSGIFSCAGANLSTSQLQLNWTDAAGNVVDTSTASLSSLGVSIPVGSLLAARGSVTSGAFQSTKATAIFQLTTIQLLGCALGTGFTNASGPFVLNISSVL